MTTSIHEILNNNVVININQDQEKIIKIVVEHLIENIIKPAIQECDIDEKSKKIIFDSIVEKIKKLKQERE